MADCAELLANATAAVGRPLTRSVAWLRLPQGLSRLLADRNGFTAFDGALLVLPLGDSAHPDLLAFKRVLDEGPYSSWKATFWPFALDAFGLPFVIDETEAVSRFDPETGMVESSGDSIEEWCRLVLEDSDYQTGHSLFATWQENNGQLEPGQRLGPKRPFFLGGEYSIENLYVADLFELTGFRQDIYQQTVDLPDGAKIRFVFDSDRE